MKSLAVESLGNEPSAASAPASADAQAHGAAARFWLRQFFRAARVAPWLVAALRPLAVRMVVRCSRNVREATAANGRRILGAQLSDRECREFGRRVVGSFYDFVADVGRCAGMSAAELRGRIETIEGKMRYAEHRRRDRRGAIIITAHMGSFEVGLASLLDVEQHVHVVYKRDAMDQFETIRRGLRQALGVREAAIDDGWGTWMALRDALAADHVVLMQADRAMPGQKAQAVPMLGGHVMLPLGPVRLAEITASPIVPVFALRTKGGRCRVIAEDPIWVDRAAEPVNGVHPTLAALGKVIERYIVAHPEQWLVLEKAFVEDSEVGVQSSEFRQ